MRILVTGGAGFIGSVTTDVLLHHGHAVTVVDDLSSGHPEAVPEEATFIRADATNLDAIEPIIAAGDFDACIHFAALIQAHQSTRHPERYFAVNTAGTATLLATLIRHRVPRFVFSSTAAVYGNAARTPIDENALLEPTSPYGESKLLVERMLAWHRRAHGLRTATLRYFNAAGATPDRGERHHPETHLIPLILEVAAGCRDHIDVYGTDYPTHDGTAVRDYVHVLDLADAHTRAVEQLAEHESLVCNLGNGSGHTVNEVIDVARRVTGHPIPSRPVPRRPGDPAVLVASSRRAQTLLGWKPYHSQLDTMISDAWAFLGSNPADDALSTRHRR